MGLFERAVTRVLESGGIGVRVLEREKRGL